MSSCLELLLDVARRRDCEAHDAALKEMDTMRHGQISPKRLLADMQREELPLEPSDCEITDESPWHERRTVRVSAGTTVDICMEAFKAFGRDSVFTVARGGQVAGGAR